MRNRIAPRVVLLFSWLFGLPAFVGCGGGGSRGSSGAVVISADPVWGGFRGGPANQGRANAASTAFGSEEWALDLGAATPAAVGLWVDGLRVKPSSQELWSVRVDGTVRWKATVGPGASTPVVDRFGRSYVGTDDGFLVKVSEDGSVLWRRSVGGDVGTGLHYARQRVLFANNTGTLSFVDYEGEVLHTLSVGAIGESVPVLAQENQLFVASTDGNLYEIKIDPATKVPTLGVQISLPGPVTRSTPASDGISVFVVTDADVLVKVFKDRFDDTSAQTVWAFDPGSPGGGASSPAIGRDGSVYFGTEDGRLIAVDANGQERWTRYFPAAIRSSPILDRDDHLLFRTADGSVHSLTREGERRYRRLRDDVTTTLDSSAAMALDGTAYLATNRGELLKLSSRTAASQRGHNAARTGIFGSLGTTEGTVAWVREAGGAPVSTLLSLRDGSLVYLDEGRKLRRYSVAGRRLKTLSLDPLTSSFSIAPDRTFVVSTSDGRLLGLGLEGAQRFSVSLGSAPLTSATVLSDGTFVVGGLDGRLSWVDGDGAITQQVTTKAMEVPPCVDADGNVYVATVGGSLRSYAEDGEFRFKMVLPGAVRRSAPLVTEDLVVVVTDNDVLVAVSRDGEGRWVFDPGVAGNSGGAGGPLLGKAGELVFATSSGVVHGRSAVGGAKVFSLDLGASVQATPVRDAAGRIYVTTIDGALHVVESNGTLRETIPSSVFGGAALSQAPALLGSRRVAVVTDDGRITTLEDELPWSVFRGSPDHRGSQAYLGPRMASVNWSVDVGGTVELSPVVAADGSVLVHTTEGELVQVDADGSVVRSMPAGAGPGLAAAHPERLFIAGATNGVLSAFNADGSAAWFRSFGSAVSGINVTRDDTLVFAVDGSLVQTDRDGSTLWSVAVGTNGEAAPGVDLDGRFFVGTAESELVAVDQSGTVEFRVALPGPATRCSPVLGPDRRIYLTTDEDVLVAVTPGGAVDWTFDPGTGLDTGGRSAPVVRSDGSVWFGAMDGFLYSVTSGSMNDSIDTGGPIQSAPIVDGEGVLYVGSDSGELFAIDDSGAIVFQFDPSGGAPSPLSSVVFANDGTLYVGARDGTLYHITDL